jgi:hypothetical protein
MLSCNGGSQFPIPSHGFSFVDAEHAIDSHAPITRVKTSSLPGSIICDFSITLYFLAPVIGTRNPWFS